MIQLDSGPARRLDMEEIDHRRRKRGDGIAAAKFAKNRKRCDFRELPKICSRIQAGMRRRRA